MMVELFTIMLIWMKIRNVYNTQKRIIIVSNGNTQNMRKNNNNNEKCISLHSVGIGSHLIVLKDEFCAHQAFSEHLTKQR
jgi:hypothetical protein